MYLQNLGDLTQSKSILDSSHSPSWVCGGGEGGDLLHAVIQGPRLLWSGGAAIPQQGFLTLVPKILFLHF